jgi:hypothetical protein
MLNDKHAASARTAINHLCNKLGIEVSDFATGAGIDPSRLQMFMSGVLPSPSDGECMAIGELMSDLVAGEDRDVQELKLRLLTPPLSTRDVVNAAK